ncbi:MAG: CpaF family protein [Gammaproteobacteria bacterium]|nr:CpaF family protein [Gammaproteobacteria bacterium]
MYIEAKASRYPVRLNGEVVRHAGPLAAGDEIRLGDANTIHLESQLPPIADELTPQTKESEYPSAGSDHETPDPELCRQLQEAIGQSLDLYRRNVLETLSPEELRAEAKTTAEAIIKRGGLVLPEEVSSEDLIGYVVAETVGLGPIETLLQDSAVSEIMVNGHDRIFIEREGRIEASPFRFSSAHSLSQVLDRIISPIGRRLDEGSPLVDARLPDGSRVNAVIPPLSLNGPVVTIRRFQDDHLDLSALTESQALNAEMALFLKSCIEKHRNLLISGGTGTGKTTLLNALSACISRSERIITIEDSAELKLQQEHVITLESRPANIEGSGEITIRDLVRNALRMRPDRILIGECRGGEALDMLQAMNTGHDGSLTTAHANTPRDALARLEVMALMAGMDLPARAIKEQIASAIDVIVQLSRMPDGSRKVVAITEVDGMEGERILLNERFVFDAESGHRSTGSFT